MHGDEEATMATLSARRAVVNDLIAERRGRIANTAGDSVLAEFASILDAVRCALARFRRRFKGQMKASLKVSLLHIISADARSISPRTSLIDMVVVA
jgi:class 3 adenylate cyclase